MVNPPVPSNSGDHFCQLAWLQWWNSPGGLGGSEVGEVGGRRLWEAAVEWSGVIVFFFDKSL